MASKLDQLDQLIIEKKVGKKTVVFLQFFDSNDFKFGQVVEALTTYASAAGCCEPGEYVLVIENDPKRSDDTMFNALLWPRSAYEAGLRTKQHRTAKMKVQCTHTGEDWIVSSVKSLNGPANALHKIVAHLMDHRQKAIDDIPLVKHIQLEHAGA